MNKNRLFISLVTIAGITLLLFSGAAVSPSRADDIEEVGDILQILLPLTAGGTTIIKGDWEGTKQFAFSFGVTMGTVQVGKWSIEKWRPKGSNAQSFPSGHTAAAFSGAAFIGTRYGWEYEIPAYAGAVFTGLSRVHAEMHYMDDVVAGASIAVLSNFLFAEPLAEGVTVSPMAGKDVVGISARTEFGHEEAETAEEKAEKFTPRYRFEFEMGPNWRTKNEFTTPPDGGTTLSLDDLDKTSNPTMTARSSFTFFLGDRHELTFIISLFLGYHLTSDLLLFAEADLA